MPGASEVFNAGYVTYANAAKIDILEVDPRLIDRHVAVRDPVARAMADGARGRARSFALPGPALPPRQCSSETGRHRYIARSPSQKRLPGIFFQQIRNVQDLVAQTAFDLAGQNCLTRSSRPEFPHPGNVGRLCLARSTLHLTKPLGFSMGESTAQARRSDFGMRSICSCGILRCLAGSAPPEFHFFYHKVQRLQRRSFSRAISLCSVAKQSMPENSHAELTRHDPMHGTRSLD